MSNNSNQSGALLLLAAVLGVVVYAFMFFGSEMEQTNLSASFGQFSKTKSVNFISNNKTTDFKAKEIRSDLTGVALPGKIMKSTSGGDYAQSSNPGFPTAGIDQAVVQGFNNKKNTSRSNGNYERNQSQSFAFGTAEVQNISNPQYIDNSDLSGMLMLDTRLRTVNSVQQGSKRATPALKAKTSAVSTNLGTNGAKKVDGGGSPGDPGASLPVGEGVWILLAMAGVYTVSRSALDSYRGRVSF